METRKTNFQLRNYQQECLAAIKDTYLKGTRRQLVCLPTGSGKTIVFSAFPDYFQMKNQMLVLAHRSELLDQARDKIQRVNPALRVEVEQAGRSADPESHVVVASVPTLGRKDSGRLSRLDPDRFFLIVVDEAHHATAKTYRNIFQYFGLFDPDTRKLLVGFTATPKRGDGEGLDTVFEEIVYSRTLPEMIGEGYLSPVAGYRVETDVDLSGVKVRMGDFVSSQLSLAVNVEQRNRLVVNVFRTLLKEQADDLFLCGRGPRPFPGGGLSRGGDMRPAPSVGIWIVRNGRRVLAGFRDGTISVVTNCMVLTEGYDEPSVEGIILARPTKSTLLYTQMIGRGTRLHPGKENVTVVDIVDVTRDHRINTLPGLFGLSEKFDLEGNTVDKVQNALKWAEAAPSLGPDRRGPVPDRSAVSLQKNQSF